MDTDNPTLKVTDFSTQTQTGSPVFIDDGLGGTGLDCKGAGARISIPLTGFDPSTTKYTEAYIFNCTNRNGDFTSSQGVSDGGPISVTGFFSNQIWNDVFSDSGNGNVNAAALSNDKLYVVVASIDLGNPVTTNDQVLSYHYAELGVDTSLTKYTNTSTSMTNFRATVANPLVYLGARSTGGQPFPDGSLIGQYSFWENEAATDLEAEEIRVIYQNAFDGISRVTQQQKNRAAYYCGSPRKESV